MWVDKKIKSGINHIWTINRIIHDQLTSVKKKPVVIQQYDYQQMFDGMDSSEACGDIFNYGVNDDHLNLIHEANKSTVINVKHLKDKVMISHSQTGLCRETHGAQPWLCTGGLLWQGYAPGGFMYSFQGEVPIPLLGQVDDLIGVAEPGHKSNWLNAYVNVKTADKDLQFGADKCKVMVVSKMTPYNFQKPDLKHKSDGEII